jgi:hypothetical protein
MSNSLCHAPTYRWIPMYSTVEWDVGDDLPCQAVYQVGSWTFREWAGSRPCMAQSPVLHIGRTSNLFKRRAEYTEEQEIRRSDGFYFSTRFLEQWYSAFGFCLHFFVSEKHVCWYMLCSGMCSLFYSSVTWNCGGAQSACDSSSQALHPSALYTHGIVRLPVPCSTILFFRVSSRDAILMRGTVNVVKRLSATWSWAYHRLLYSSACKLIVC